jgi:hypothetical protein
VCHAWLGWSIDDGLKGGRQCSVTCPLGERPRSRRRFLRPDSGTDWICARLDKCKGCRLWAERRRRQAGLVLQTCASHVPGTGLSPGFQRPEPRSRRCLSCRGTRSRRHGLRGARTTAAIRGHLLRRLRDRSRWPQARGCSPVGAANEPGSIGTACAMKQPALIVIDLLNDFPGGGLRRLL